jgi:phosphoribosyl-ATP pyrophosphohydrolase/phosphoribosyl-AMP cyclohydrolase
MQTSFEFLQFQADGLIPVVVQEASTKEVLMLAYMNQEALEITLRERTATYYSRSRKKLWKKGETSGHVQTVEGLSYDCDADALLLFVTQTGVACHTNHMSCFHQPILRINEERPARDVLEELMATIQERKIHPIEGSYTNYLFAKGIDKILKKVGEETAEVIIAAKNQSVSELTYELSDLVYHSLVLMTEAGVSLPMIEAELNRRRALKSEK